MKAVYATPGNRTLPNSLEGCYANHYTSAAYSREPNSKMTWKKAIFPDVQPLTMLFMNRVTVTRVKATLKSVLRCNSAQTLISTFAQEAVSQSDARYYVLSLL